MYAGGFGLTSSQPVQGDPMSPCGLRAGCSNLLLLLTLSVTSQAAILLDLNLLPQPFAVQRLQNCHCSQAFVLQTIAAPTLAGIR